MNVPLSPDTFDTVLSRTRDTDPVARKLVYSAVLQPKLGHPRQLTISQREQVVNDGLGDREPAVRLAAGKMVANWFDVVLADRDAKTEETWVGDDAGVMHAFVKFLALFDVVGPGEAVAVDAMLSVFIMRPDLSDAFVFSGTNLETTARHQLDSWPDIQIHIGNRCHRNVQFWQEFSSNIA